MAKYQFTNACGNRMVELCLNFNKDNCLGCIPHEFVVRSLRAEDYYSEYALGEFVRWLHGQARSSSSAAIVLGLVAVGLADEVRRDREFIDKVESFHTAMTRRFGIDSSDIVKGDE